MASAARELNLGLQYKRLSMHLGNKKMRQANESDEEILAEMLQVLNELADITEKSEKERWVKERERVLGCIAERASSLKL